MMPRNVLLARAQTNQPIASAEQQSLGNFPLPIEVVPMADGGEGTAEAICDARGSSWIECKSHDPLGREIDGGAFERVRRFVEKLLGRA